jgi:hypothetical protein
MASPPNVGVDFDDLPGDPKARHEVLVGVFGAYLMWARKVALDTTRQRVESEDERRKLGNLFRVCYEDIASFQPADREKAYQLAEAAIASFAKIMLTMISGEGYEEKMGPDYVFRYKLIMEICRMGDDRLVMEEIINRNGKRFFPEYWGRWLNQSEGQSGR